MRQLTPKIDHDWTLEISAKDGRAYVRCPAIRGKDRGEFRRICMLCGADPRESLTRTYHFPLENLHHFMEFAQHMPTKISPKMGPEIARYVIRLEREKVKWFHKGTLRPYQQYGAEYLRANDRALLLDEMGLGKTVEVLAALPRGQAVLIICPASLRLNWVVEGEKWRPDYRYFAATKTSQIRPPDNGEVMVVSFDGAKSKADLLVDTLPILGWSVLIIDEVHFCKADTAQRTKAVRKIVQAYDRVWGLTGTPITNTPEDLRGVLRTVGLFEQSFGTDLYFNSQFGSYINDEGGISWPEEVPHPQHVVSSLSRVSLRRTRAQVLPEIPAKCYAEMAVDISDAKMAMPQATKETLEVYEAINHGGLEDIPMDENLSTIRKAVAIAKIPAMKEFVQRFLDTKTPLVVACFNRDPLIAIKEMGYPVIMGSTSSKARQKGIEDFQAGMAPIIGIQLKAGGVGITLTHGHHMLVVQRDWSPATNVQAEDRICRHGQTEKCVIYDLLANHPIDEIISRYVLTKQKRIAATVESVTAKVTDKTYKEERVERIKKCLNTK